MITQLFITNWILLLTMTIVDEYFLSGAIERMKYVGTVFAYWTLSSLIAIPFWALYLIWSL